jgi:predicted DNA binding CopG/RHH family protein
MKKQSKRAVPAFASEAEEAAWWYENRKSHDREFAAAVENDEVQVLTREKLQERIEASKAKTPGRVISLRVAEADLAMARRQAEQKGLPYQTYIKSLLHETLADREKRKAG